MASLFLKNVMVASLEWKELLKTESIASEEKLKDLLMI